MEFTLSVAGTINMFEPNSFREAISSTPNNYLEAISIHKQIKGLVLWVKTSSLLTRIERFNRCLVFHIRIL